jgi:hypothetical protein
LRRKTPRMTAEAHRRTTYRSTEQAWLFIVMGVVFAAATIGGMVSSVAQGTTNSLVFLIAIVPITWFFVIRLPRTGAYVESDGLRIVNPLRTLNIDWAEIVSFELGWSSQYGIRGVGLVNLAGGRVVPIFGIQKPNPIFRPKNSSAQDLIAELNDVLAEVRAAQSTVV